MHRSLVKIFAFIVLCSLCTIFPEQTPAWEKFMGAQLSQKPDQYQTRLWGNLQRRWKKVIKKNSANPLFGSDGQARFPAKYQRYWEQMLAAVRDKDAMTKARAVCGFVNTQFHSATDMELYNFPDYWAAPVEMTDKGAGDSEDFAIIKYFALRALGFSADDIRLLIVKMGSGSRATWSALLGVRVDGNFFVQDFDFRPADLLLPANEAMSRLYHLTIAFNEDGVWYYR